MSVIASTMAYYTAVTTIVTPLEKMVAQACSAQHSKIRTHVEKTGEVFCWFWSGCNCPLIGIVRPLPVQQGV